MVSFSDVRSFSRSRRALSLLLVLTLFFGGGAAPRKMTPAAAPIAGITNPILFAAQVPVAGDFLTVVSTFGNHRSQVEAAPRGGDLMIRYPDGTLKNLTRLAGFGTAATAQGVNAIAVREPSVHWSGTRAIFSMVIGAPSKQFEQKTFFWQLYEVTGLGINDTPVITKVPNQPPHNNIGPIYGTDDRIIFVSDRPRNGAAHLLQLDEYEVRTINSGIWSLDPASGDLDLLDHSPSGDFGASIDSFGRVIFTRWDHLQRDQARDGDDSGETNNGTFDYVDESANAARVAVRPEQFPEPRPGRTDLLAGTNLTGHRFNHFFPWEMNEDGTELETINHIGRHELHNFFEKAMKDDSNQRDFVHVSESRLNQTFLLNMMQIKEDPTQPGLYYGIDAPEFETHAGGQVVTLTAPPSLPADQVPLKWITHRETANVGAAPQPNHSGFYRNPLPLSTGTVVVSHSTDIRAERNDGTRANPISRYTFRLKTLVSGGQFSVAGTPLTDGIQRSVTYFDPDVQVSWSGVLWELDPVEVKARTRPARRTTPMQAPEAAIFQEEGVSVAAFKAYLEQNNLAVIVMRDITTRDRADRQQPFNLRVAGTTKQSVGAGGKIYDVKYLELFQGDQLRGIGGTASPGSGRRVLAQHMHDPAAKNPNAATVPPGSVKVAADGSVAAFVPARRALTWQLTNDQAPVVRERYWLTFQPGEIRLCASCHGLNSRDQKGAAVPTQKPEALRELLQFFKAGGGPVTPPAGRKKGDVNGNGDVTAFDAALVLQAVVGTTTLDPTQQCAADYNDNGSPSAFDAALMLQCVVGGTCNQSSCTN